MEMRAWRNTVHNPVDDPQVTISLAPVQKFIGVFPWVLPLNVAREIFGAVVDKITEEPVPIRLEWILISGGT